MPASRGERSRIELRSPDPAVNPYLAYALVLSAGMDGIRRQLPLPDPVDLNLFTADRSVTRNLALLPASLEEARGLALQSPFIRQYMPEILEGRPAASD